MALNTIQRNKSVLIITDRVELLTQAEGALTKFKLDPKILKAGTKNIPNEPLIVAMAETIKRRLGSKKSEEYQTFLQRFDLVIIDEAHKQSFDRILSYLTPSQYVIGATATPYRRGRKATQLSEHYNNIVMTIDIPELIRLGFLAQPKSYGNEVDLSSVRIENGEYSSTDMQKIYSRLNQDLITNYEKHSKGQKAVLFASNVQNSKDACQAFNESGYTAKHLDGTTPTKLRSEILYWYDITPGAILCNANIVTTGWDSPTTETVILYRATTSLPLFLQMVGRGSRTTETKSTFTILDFGNNISRHGFWEAPREWSLNHSLGIEGIAPTKFCPKCDAIILATKPICPFCGAAVTVPKKIMLEELVKLSYTELAVNIDTAINSEQWEQLDLLVQARGYKKSWIIHKLANRKDVLRRYVKYKGYKSYYVHNILKNRKR